MPLTNKELETQERLRTQRNAETSKPIHLRIISWEVRRLELKEEEETSSKTALAASPTIAKTPDETLNAIKRGGAFLEPSRASECEEETGYTVRLLVQAVPMDAWKSAVDSANKISISKSLLFEEALTLTNRERHALEEVRDRIAIYEVSYSSSSVLDFDIDSNEKALKGIYDGPTKLEDVNISEVKMAKIVDYSSSGVAGIPGTNSRPGKRFSVTSSQSFNFNKDAASILKKVKEKVEDRAPEEVKRIQKYIDQNASVMSKGETRITLKSGDPSRKKPSTKMVAEGLEMKAGFNSVKMGKTYRNLSKKVDYATAPFQTGFSGWRPNMLGKFFGSDNVKEVQTWKRTLGLHGNELIRIAVAATALKAFRVGIEKSGIKKSLKEASIIATQRSETHRTFSGSLDISINEDQRRIDKFIRK